MEEIKDTGIKAETAEATEPAKKTRTRAAAKSSDEKKTQAKAPKKTAKSQESAEKKTRTPRTAKKPDAEVQPQVQAEPTEPEVSVVIQYGSREVTAKDVAAAAVEAYKAAHEGAVVHTVTAYVKPDENAVYYVVNGDDSEGSNKLELFR